MGVISSGVGVLGPFSLAGVCYWDPSAICRVSERAGIWGFSANSPVHHEAQDWGGFGVVIPCRDRHLSLELGGVCDPAS